MSDLDSFLIAIEDNPLDNALWLVFADWLEERGDWRAQGVRTVVETGGWKNAFRARIRALDGRSQRLLACDCVEQMLPLFEECYPIDRAPRRLVELYRLYGSGRKIRAAREAVTESFRVAELGRRRVFDGYWLAYNVARLTLEIGPRPDLVCFNTVRLAVGVASGPAAATAVGVADALDPRWKARLDASYRWQFARLFRYLTESDDTSSADP